MTRRISIALETLSVLWLMAIATSCNDRSNRQDLNPTAPVTKKSDIEALARIALANSAKQPKPSAAEVAQLEAIKASPRFAELKARQQRIVGRGIPAVAFSEQSLPAGTEAIVRLGQQAPVNRYLVFSRDGFTDELYHRALLIALQYEATHEDDSSPVSISLFTDGGFERVSRLHGVERGIHKTVSSPNVKSNVQSAALLRAAVGVAPHPIPGVGLARLVRPE